MLWVIGLKERRYLVLTDKESWQIKQEFILCGGQLWLREAIPLCAIYGWLRFSNFLFYSHKCHIKQEKPTTPEILQKYDNYYTEVSTKGAVCKEENTPVPTVIRKWPMTWCVADAFLFSCNIMFWHTSLTTSVSFSSHLKLIRQKKRSYNWEIKKAKSSSFGAWVIVRATRHTTFVCK